MKHIKASLSFSLIFATSVVYALPFSIVPNGALPGPNPSDSLNVTLTPAVLTAVGGLTNSLPLLVASVDGGVTWGVQSVKGTPANGNYTGTSCTGSGSTAICTAAGQNYVTIAPMLAVSTNGGASWAIQPVTGAPADGAYFSTSCTGSGSTAICTAVGLGLSSTSPLLAVSTNGGMAWAVKPITGVPADGEILSSTSCTGSGSTAICTAAGGTFSDTPILAVSTNGGMTWAVQHVTGAPANGTYNGTSCTGSGSTAICTAVGDYVFANVSIPMLAVSTNGGISWAMRTCVAGAPPLGIYHSTSCTGSGSTAICTAAGGDLLSPVSGPALLAASVDGGITWAAPSVTGAPTFGAYSSTSCTGSGSTAICTAAGQNGVTGAPMLAVSTNGGISWAIQAVAGAPAAGNYNSTSCTGSGSTAICTAAGQDTVTNFPLLAVSTDGAKTWAVIPVVSSPGSFIGTGASRSFLNDLYPTSFGMKKALEKLITRK